MGRAGLGLAVALTIFLAALTSFASAPARPAPSGEEPKETGPKAPIPAPVVADDPAIPLAEYRERRQELVRRLRKLLAAGERGVFLWRSGRESVAEERFRPDPNFFYLTGFEEPDAAVLLSFDVAAYEETLLLSARDPSQERWTGEKLGPGGTVAGSGDPDEERRKTMAATGFAAVAPADRLDRILESRGGLPEAARFWLRHDSGGLAEEPTREQRFLETVRLRFPKLHLADPSEDLARMRLVKSPAEIALIEKAVQITSRAHIEAMRQARHIRREYEVQGIVEGSFLKQGALGPSFFSIVGAGRNATILHYTRTRGPVAVGDLVLVDIGAEVGRYGADLTRTWPASGRFTARQRELYEIVRKAQTDAASLIRPGATLQQIHAKAKEVLEAAGLAKYFPHGTSHYLGLEVHDPGAKDWPLPAGAVLTVEPGVYIPGEGIGIRIEDDYLVTVSGSRKLSAALPSESGEIEKVASVSAP
jgi:Xaa-Pro aminopeptidase